MCEKTMMSSAESPLSHSTLKKKNFKNGDMCGLLNSLGTMVLLANWMRILMCVSGKYTATASRQLA